MSLLSKSYTISGKVATLHSLTKAISMRIIYRGRLNLIAQLGKSEVGMTEISEERGEWQEERKKERVSEGKRENNGGIVQGRGRKRGFKLRSSNQWSSVSSMRGLRKLRHRRE